MRVCLAVTLRVFVVAAIVVWYVWQNDRDHLLAIM